MVINVDVSDLVRTVVREVLAQMRGDNPRQACVLVLAGRDGALAQRIRQSLGEDADLLFAGEDAAGRTPDRTVLPLLSCRDMAELAGGGASGQIPSEVLRLLLLGREVEVLEFEYKAYAETAPGPLYALYEAQERTLASYGLKAFRAKRPETVRFRDGLVTAKDVERAKAQGAATLLVSESARITPLAAETADGLNISIRKEE